MKEKVVFKEDTTFEIDDLLVKMRPAFRQCVWGGTNLSKVLGKRLYGKTDVGETWEISVHPDGESVIEDGKYKGTTLKQFIRMIGKEKLGRKYQKFKEFPLLIKLIDAQQNLSVQVHPDDAYAYLNENEYGKNEMLYIVAAKADAFIYAGFNRDVSREEILRRIEKNTLEEVLQKISVQAGQTYFLPAGTVHAIGHGCIVCEIEQSSNVTYRLYDYDRKNRRGERRELHIDKALEVLNLKSAVENFQFCSRSEPYGKGNKTLLGECKYFSAIKYEAKEEIALSVDGSSFRAFVVLEGKGKVTIDEGNKFRKFKKGDTFFGVANRYIFQSKEKMSIIAVGL